MRRMLVSVLLASVAMLGSVESYAERGPALSADLAFRAFECSRLAAEQGDDHHKARLFQLGIAEARTAARAYLAGELDQVELVERYSLAAFRVEGPTPDFLAGRWYEVAWEHAYASVQQRMEKNLGRQPTIGAGGGFEGLRRHRQIAATELYREENCEHLGRGG